MVRVMSKEKILETFEKLIGQCDGASGRLIMTAMSGNKEVKEAMDMITNVSIELGLIAEEFEYNDNILVVDNQVDTCGGCSFYSERDYQCHNEHGKEAHCSLGFMNGDMRDKSFKHIKYDGCKLGK